MSNQLRFEQIAVNSTAKKKPVPEDRLTYIGLEHLDSGTLKVSRYGAETAPIGEKLIMKKGDILFGKRRAYQKKVAIAPFDGIFSAHGMVLRPNTKYITPDFFPFFLSSDYFLDQAIKISVGSLSPTINWRDLCELQFTLPSKEDQIRLAGILWKIENAKNACAEAVLKAKQLLSAFLDDAFAGRLNLPGTEQLRDYPLGQIVEIVKRKNSKLETSRVLTISASDGIVDQLEYFHKSVASKDLSGYTLLKRGEFAYNKSYSLGNPLGIIKRLEKYEDGAVSNLYICFSKKEGWDSDFLKLYFQSTCWHDSIYRIVEEGARAHGLLNMSKKDFLLAKQHLSMDPAFQKAVIKHAALLQSQIDDLEDELESLVSLQRSINSSWYKED